MTDVTEWKVGDFIFFPRDMEVRRIDGIDVLSNGKIDIFSGSGANFKHILEERHNAKNITAIERELAELKREKEEDFNLFGVEID